MNSYNKSNINKRSLPIQIQQPSPINKRENEMKKEDSKVESSYVRKSF